jgi:hypothetical protein
MAAALRGKGKITRSSVSLFARTHYEKKGRREVLSGLAVFGQGQEIHGVR